MDHEGILDLLQRATVKTQYDALRRTVDWLVSRSYISHDKASLARDIIDFASSRDAPEMLVGAALMIVPEDWNGDVSFGKGLKRVVLFSPSFVASGDEQLVDAEHEIPAIALAMAAVRTRP